jgi:hypothetical protein
MEGPPEALIVAGFPCVMEAVTYGRKKVSVAVKWDSCLLDAKTSRYLRSLLLTDARVDNVHNTLLRCAQLHSHNGHRCLMSHFAFARG